MPEDVPDASDLDDLKSAAAAFTREKVTLEARAKELDALETELSADRINLGGQALALESVRAVIMKERDKGAQAKSSLKRDAAVIQADRLALAAEENRLLEFTRVLEERDRILGEAEARLEQRHLELSSRMEAFQARLETLDRREGRLAQREQELEETAARVAAFGEAIRLREARLCVGEEEFIRSQNARLAALDAHENDLVAFQDAVAAVEAEATRRAESYASMEAALQEDMDRVVVARSWAASEKDRLIEVQAILEGTVQSDEVESEATPSLADASAPADSIPAEAPDTTETAPVPGSLGGEGSVESLRVPPTTKEGAVSRLAQAVRAWERARAAGWDVSGLAGPAKSARTALVSGDYDGALRLATTMMDRLRANPTA